MKIRSMLLICLIAGVILLVGYEVSAAKTKTTKRGFSAGVVSVRKIFQECKRNVKYREESKAEQEKLIAELSKLNAEVEAGKAGLRTLKPGSSDHMSQMKSVLEKEASLQAQQEFYKQQLEMKDQRWTEELYKDILRIVAKVAEQKGLDLVLEKDEVDFPSMNANDLMLTIRTHKVFYNGGCTDITKAVMGQLDAGK